jgi:hypothetical protein
MKAEGRDSSKEGGKNAQSKDSISKDSAQSKDSMSKDKNGMSKDSAQSKDKSGMSKDSAQDTKSGSSSQTTTGAAPATAAPPPEKRTQIVSAKSERIEETKKVNFNISVGATVPASVRFHPVPARIVEIYPEWRGFEIIFVHGRYIIVRPQTHEIVYIIEG